MSRNSEVQSRIALAGYDARHGPAACRLAARLGRNGHAHLPAAGAGGTGRETLTTARLAKLGEILRGADPPPSDAAVSELVERAGFDGMELLFHSVFRGGRVAQSRLLARAHQDRRRQFARAADVGGPRQSCKGGPASTRRSGMLTVPKLTAILGIVLAVSAASSPARADDAGRLALYEAITIVTGQREETRLPGIRRCFIDVLQKVSGDQRLGDAAGLPGLADQATSSVTGFRYQDRLWRRPIHDEQGTRDRPYDLTVDFDGARIDAVLRSLGREPWTGPRPRIAAVVAVRQGATDYLTSTDGEHGYGQASAFADASERTGLPVLVPSQADLTRSGITEELVRGEDRAAFETAAAALGAEAPLRGVMTFDDAAGGWAVDWRFDWRGSMHRWRVAGVNFDAAFLNGMRGVAQVISSHGEP